MRTFITTIALAVAGLLAVPNTSEAGRLKVGHSHTYVSGHASCGCPIYTKRIFRGYDRYHRPIYKYNRLSLRHNSKYHVKRGYRNYGHHGYYNRGYRSGYGYRGYSNSGRRYGGYGYRSRGGYCR